MKVTIKGIVTTASWSVSALMLLGICCSYLIPADPAQLAGASAIAYSYKIAADLSANSTAGTWTSSALSAFATVFALAKVIAIFVRMLPPICFLQLKRLSLIYFLLGLVPVSLSAHSFGWEYLMGLWFVAAFIWVPLTCLSIWKTSREILQLTKRVNLGRG